MEEDIYQESCLDAAMKVQCDQDYVDRIYNYLIHNLSFSRCDFSEKVTYKLTDLLL